MSFLANRQILHWNITKDDSEIVEISQADLKRFIKAVYEAGVAVGGQSSEADISMSFGYDQFYVDLTFETREAAIEYKLRKP